MKKMDEPGRFDEEPIGWKIVSIGHDGSVLCESPQGHRRRYVFRLSPEDAPKTIVISAKATPDSDKSCGTCMHWRSWTNIPKYIEAGIGTCHHPSGDKAAALRSFICPFWEQAPFIAPVVDFNPPGVRDGYSKEERQ